ncbi:hypothetical protein [Streptomyces sp. NPDC085540]|uniref:hypothetical protein n=1 Tax=Streptomyces sp. NPDC085540 TaxID=3365730 RepID=UPI0037D45748
MRRTPAPAGTVARFPRRVRHALATTALAALALSACGIAKAGPVAVRSESADTAGTGPSLAEVRERVERSCPPSALPVPPPTGPASALPPGAAKVPSDVEPVAPTTGPEAELNARDWCASALHEERIAQALQDLTDPTPAEVRKILNDLGYVDQRIHDLKRSGATTRFFLDLRDEGGRLCLEGSAAGEETVVDTCVAPVSGPFAAGSRTSGH